MKRMVLRLFGLIVPMFVSATAFAQDGSGSNESDEKMFLYLAMALSIGIAAFGGSLGQGRAAAAALEGIARNPNASGKIFTPMILGLALIESLVIYAFIVSFLLYTQLGG